MADVAHLLRMPEVAAGSDHAVLQDWSVAVNEEFSASDPLATIETDKAVVEVEAESAGVILRALVTAGAEVAVGAPIAVIGEPGEDVPDVDALLDELDPGRGEAGAPGGGAAPDETEQPDGDGAAGGGAAPDETEPPDGDGAGEAPSPSATAASRSRLFISPLARRLAVEAGLDASQLVGTGPKGRIRKRDVEAALAGGTGGSSAGAQPSTTDPARPRESPAADAAGGGTGGFTDAPHTRVRRAVAARLTESKQTVPHFYVRGTANVEALVALRAQLNDEAPVKISFNDLLVKAVAVAHRRHPELNVIWTDDAVRAFEHVDIAVAIASERGLVTPVLRGVDTMSLTEVAEAVRAFAERADAGTLKQRELEGGTVSLSNLGMFGVEEFSAIINPPHASILSVGAIREEPVVREGGLGVGRVLHLVLSVDHRPVDGAAAAAWMRTFLSLLERPVQILA